MVVGAQQTISPGAGAAIGAERTTLEWYVLEPTDSPAQRLGKFSADVRRFLMDNVSLAGESRGSGDGIVTVREVSIRQAMVALQPFFQARMDRGAQRLSPEEALVHAEEKARKTEEVKDPRTGLTAAETELLRLNRQRPDGDSDDKTWRASEASVIFFKRLQEKYGSEYAATYLPPVGTSGTTDTLKVLLYMEGAIGKDLRKMAGPPPAEKIFWNEMLPKKPEPAGFGDALAHAVTVFNHASLTAYGDYRTAILPEHVDKRMTRLKSLDQTKEYPTGADWIRDVQKVYPDDRVDGKYNLDEACRQFLGTLRKNYYKKFIALTDFLEDHPIIRRNSLELGKAPDNLKLLREMDNEVNRDPQMHRLLRESMDERRRQDRPSLR